MTSDKQKVYLVCGSGGVGKTTIAASLGLKYALAGKNTIVLTIDPAKRLATSLGLSELNNDPVSISLDSLNKKTNGKLFAMMLDTKSTFDKIIEKHATSKENKDKILQNKLYQNVSKMLAGTQEYMAMERLYDIYNENQYDVIIIDTPPLQNTRDFLEAPEKMRRMLGNSMIQILLKPSLSFGIKGFKLFEKGTQKILKLFDKITGYEFLQEISEMTIAFKDLLDGFDKRAEAVQNLLKKSSCQFISVCSAQKHSITEAIDFKEQIDEFKYHLDRFIVNRVYLDLEQTQSLGLKDFLKKDKKNLLKDFIEMTQKTFSDSDSKVLFENFYKYLPLIENDKKNITKLKKITDENNITKIPLFLTDVHDIKSLFEITKYL